MRRAAAAVALFPQIFCQFEKERKKENRFRQVQAEN